MKKRSFLLTKKFAALVAVVVLVLVAFGAWKLYTSGLLTDEATLRAFIEEQGVMGPVVLIGVIVLEVIVAPLPGGIPPVLAGYLFGPVEGALYAWIGNVIGSIVTFGLARWIGNRFAEKFVESEELEKYSAFVNQRGWVVWLAYSIPFVFPADLLNISLGLTTISFRRYLKIMMLGFLVHVSLPSLLGSIVNIDELASIGYMVSGVVLVLIVGFLIKKTVIDPRV